MDDLISILDNRMQNTTVVAENDTINSRLEMDVRQNQYASSRTPKRLIKDTEVYDIVGSNPEMLHLAALNKNDFSHVNDEPLVENSFEQWAKNPFLKCPGMSKFITETSSQKTVHKVSETQRRTPKM